MIETNSCIPKDPLNYYMNDGLEKIKIERCTSGDSRVAKEAPTIDEFDRANRMHQDDVMRLCARFINLLVTSIRRHDWTKTEEPYRSMFYKDLCNTINGQMKFMDGKWAAFHYNELERHHLQEHVPDDVNLFDVIEMMCDCIAAGMARNEEEFYSPDISPDILIKAFNNTVKILKEQVDVVDRNGTALSTIDVPTKPIFGDAFHGEIWYKCPRCGVAFEYYDAVYERGFTHVKEGKYRHNCCGQLIDMGV